MNRLEHIPWIARMLHPEVLLVIGAISLALAVATVIVLPFVLTRLPADYLAKPRRPHSAAFRIIVMPLKTALGICLLSAGIAMLVLPGQGILTILVALLLIDFPGKRRLVHRLLAHPRVLGSINRIRTRAGRLPLRLDAPTPPVDTK